MKEKRLSLAFTLICQYAKQQGWTPIGHKVFTVGDWRIEVNGTHKYFGTLPSFHAVVKNLQYVGTMVMSAYGGKVSGYKDTEAEFVAAMRAALEALGVERDMLCGIPAAADDLPLTHRPGEYLGIDRGKAERGVMFEADPGSERGETVQVKIDRAKRMK